jgi:quinol monooxygenase YgiN
MSYVLVVRMTAQEGNEAEAAPLLRELAEATRGEPGCEHYIPVQDPENPSAFLIYEQYRDKAAFEEHGASDHFQAIAVGKLFPLMESPRERSFYETL